MLREGHRKRKEERTERESWREKEEADHKVLQGEHEVFLGDLTGDLKEKLEREPKETQ